MCAGGVLWQLIVISELYFQYKVSTTTNVFTPETLNPLAMTLCVQIAHVADLERVKQDFKITTLPNDAYGDVDFKNWTLRQLFDYTPSSDTILVKFFYKTKNAAELIEVSSNVNRHIEVVKFLQRVYVCYKITLKDDQPIKYREISVTSTWQFQVKKLVFNESVMNSKAIKVMLGNVNHLPYKEMISTKYNIRSLDSSGHLYTSKHMTIEKHLLERPFETQCIEYITIGFHDQHHCIEECVAAHIFKSFRKVSLLSPVIEASSLKPLTLEDLRDKAMSVNVSKMQEFCQTVQCRNIECHDEEIVTSTDSGTTYENTSQTVWEHQVTSQISFKITSRPTLSFVEFFIYVLGTISTWFGLSVITCNPVVLFKYLIRLQKFQTQNTEPNARQKELLERRRRIEGEDRRRSLQARIPHTSGILDFNTTARDVSRVQ